MSSLMVFPMCPKQDYTDFFQKLPTIIFASGKIFHRLLLPKNAKLTPFPPVFSQNRLNRSSLLQIRKGSASNGCKNTASI
ncbi:hypothetical protein OFBG_01122 [Oxalobacter formigenes OXCC13]|uniref:Uncharacterized protein n=1 Tax=Oxalobacter formigenes OXCC13 TaxID=556269 RepID=C3XA68_OXAFO|nr:hypothetical protein OFBG_01122 [Oxalobacter formigenes OXCC13]